MLSLSLNAAPNYKRHTNPATQQSSIPPTTTFALLTQHLTTNCKTDSQKAYAIFRWIADNISYDVCDFHNIDSPYNAIPNWPPEWGYSAYGMWHNNQVAKLVLERRLGVCDGYARLFKAMCDVANVESVVINGYARREEGIGRQFGENHAWNAVHLNGTWRLLDATWAAGSCDSGTQYFTRDFSGRYWMTPPDEMLQDHYPANQEWALVKVLPPLYSFFREPLHHPDYLTSCIKAYSPDNGLLDALPGQTCVFSLTGMDTILIPEISFIDYNNDWHLADGQPGEALQLASLTYLYENHPFALDPIDTLPQPARVDSLALRMGVLDRIRPDSLYRISGNTCSYKFNVPPAGAKYIFISCNGRLLLTYAVRRPTAAAQLPPRSVPHQ